MKVSHEQYLKSVLESRKMQRENLEIEHRIAIAEHNVKKEMLFKEIHSIEQQLNSHK